MTDGAKEESSKGGRIATSLYILAALVVIFAGIKAAERIFVPFLLSVFIAVIVSPVMLWLRRRGVGSAVALTLMVLALVGILIALTSLVSSTMYSFGRDMPEYQRLLAQKTGLVAAWLEEKGMEAPEQFLQDQIKPQALLRFTGTLIGSLSGMLGNSFFILLTVVFMLLEGSAFAAKLDALPEGMRRLTDRYGDVVAGIRRYMAIKTLISASTGLLVMVMLSVLGIKYAVLWGVLAFLLNYVPNIGSFIAAVPPVLLALLLEDSLWMAVWVAVGFTAINILMANLIEPRVTGQGVGLSTLVVFLSLVFWGWLLGPVGMLLSVPLTISVKIALSSDESTRPIALLLGPATPPAVPPPPPAVPPPSPGGDPDAP
ncbi:MAG: AI-2E family transporter [Candidatus Brocadiaceae bacterium]|nr:AI-2E family transporter [Candidatus Brocadiaceae bacterium]